MNRTLCQLLFKINDMKKVMQSMFGLLLIAASFNISAQNSNHLKHNTMTNLKAGVNKVTFTSFGVELAGDLYLPEGFDANKKYKAIVGASPFPQVKEQIPATYGPEMAARGFIYLGFDYL